MALLLLSSWTWDRVVLDCRGNSERVNYYYFQATMRENRWVQCADLNGVPFLCLRTLPAAPVAFGPNIGDPGKGATVTTWFDPVTYPHLLPTPPVGGLAIWPWVTPDNPSPIVAVDYAGNRSCVACPP